MSLSYRGTWSRRELLWALGSGASAARGAAPSGMPGPYRGVVAAVESPAAIANGQYQAESVRRMMRRGMELLTGAGWVDAWRQFVRKGEVVAIKVNPVGGKLMCSAPEVLREIVAGLMAAGIPARDIVVYDRYRKQLLEIGFHQWAQDGVRHAAAVEDYDPVQQAIEGYDPDHYIDMALTLPGQDSSSLTARRSYAARFLTREADKLINLCVLKDHQSAGVTLALKNLSHGLVNNVSRSHSSKTLNACGTFIPAVVAMPVIRRKAVLHILDGVKGLYHGGPFGRPRFIWEHKTLYFATDPVALDHVGWRAIDQKRAQVGKKPLVEDTPDEFSTFVHRQPEHVEIAGALGLGEWEWEKIQVRRERV